MNTKFENIFEKFNLSCKVPNKSRKYVHQRKKSFKFEKHLLRLPLDRSSTFQKPDFCRKKLYNGSNTAGNSNALHCHSINQSNEINLRPQSTLNETGKGNRLRGGYCSSLDVVVLQKPHKATNNLEEYYNVDQISNDSFILSKEVNRTPNTSNYINSGEDSPGIMKKLPFTCSFNLKNTVSRGRKCTKSCQFKPLNISIIPKRHNTNISINESDESILKSSSPAGFNTSTCFDNNRDDLFVPFFSSSPKPSQIIESSASTYKSDIKNVTELDLLIDLTERDERPKEINENRSNSRAFNEGYVEQFSPFLSSSPKPSQLIESSASTQKSDDKNLTELDLLIDLIERDERSKKINENKKENKSKSRVLNGGYEKLFQRALALDKTKCRFLKYDRKFGVNSGQLLRIVDIHTFYGTLFAIVESDISPKPFGIVISLAMLPLIKIGSELEAFLDDSITPYKLKVNNNILDIYLEPYKLLIL